MVLSILLFKTMGIIVEFGKIRSWFAPTDNQLGKAKSSSEKVKIESKVEAISFEEI